MNVDKMRRQVERNADEEFHQVVHGRGASAKPMPFADPILERNWNVLGIYPDGRPRWPEGPGPAQLQWPAIVARYGKEEG